MPTRRLPTITKNQLLSFDIRKVENGFVISELFVDDDIPTKQHICNNIDAVIAFVDKTFDKR